MRIGRNEYGLHDHSETTTTVCYGVRYDETRQPKYIDHGQRYSNYGSFNGYNSYDMYSCDQGYMLSAATSKMASYIYS